MLLTSWWSLTSAALARSYPPALGCVVLANASADGKVLDVRGMGFRAGATVLVSVAGRRAGGAVADPAGSFEAAWPVAGLRPGATVAAADGACAVTSVLSAHNQPSLRSEIPPPPPAATLRGNPVLAVIPLIPLTGLPPHLFLGLAGALLLAGVALTGLTGRWGHRSERRPAAGSSASSALPLISPPPTP
ncbi:MAG TPA: hypothetical protein VGB75_08875 [Jatrophihabitans sp.]|uniref:hypothetical protein n=1 Tax=Jatrophihabitans sp. TaxID=1932789 RepID=UPI002F1A0B3B